MRDPGCGERRPEVEEETEPLFNAADPTPDLIAELPSHLRGQPVMAKKGRQLAATEGVNEGPLGLVERRSRAITSYSINYGHSVASIPRATLGRHRHSTLLITRALMQINQKFRLLALVRQNCGRKPATARNSAQPTFSDLTGRGGKSRKMGLSAGLCGSEILEE